MIGGLQAITLTLVREEEVVVPHIRGIMLLTRVGGGDNKEEEADIEIFLTVITQGVGEASTARTLTSTHHHTLPDTGEGSGRGGMARITLIMGTAVVEDIRM